MLLQPTTHKLVTEQGFPRGVHRFQYYDMTLENRKAFIAKSTSQETGGKAQICLLDPEFSVSFGVWGTRLECGSTGQPGFEWRTLDLSLMVIYGKGLLHLIFLDSGHFAP